MKKALILAAHADDETLGCGGTLQVLIKEGWEIDVVILSDGYRYGGLGKNNLNDTKKACDILGIQNLHFLDFPDQKFDTIPIAVIAEKVYGLKLLPDLIFCNDSFDLNSDHRITCEVAKIVGRPREKPISILAMEIPNTAFWNGNDFKANFFVDITETIDKKIKAFRCYSNEIKKFPDPWSVEGLYSLAKFRGMQCGMTFAESFRIIRAYPNCLPGSIIN